MSRSKDIGTKAETAVVKALRTHGFPGAERRALHGSQDLGDVLAAPGIIMEVKGGKAAEEASQKQVDAWMAETERERQNAHAFYGFLITKRKGYGPDRAQHWWAHVAFDIAAELGCGKRPEFWTNFSVRMELRHLLYLLNGAGWGDPIIASEENG